MSYRILIAIMFLFGSNISVYAADMINTTKQAEKIPIVKATTLLTHALNINKATEAELLTVKGMTKSKAKAILSYRKKEGDFKTLDTLSELKGFKRMKVESRNEIKSQLTL